MPSSPAQALEMYVAAAQEDGDAACGYRVSLMALKCLNNAVWDQPAGQISFVRLGGLGMLVGLLQVLVSCCCRDAALRRLFLCAGISLRCRRVMCLLRNSVFLRSGYPGVRLESRCRGVGDAGECINLQLLLVQL